MPVSSATCIKKMPVGCTNEQYVLVMPSGKAEAYLFLNQNCRLRGKHEWWHPSPVAHKPNSAIIAQIALGGSCQTRCCPAGRPSSQDQLLCCLPTSSQPNSAASTDSHQGQAAEEAGVLLGAVGTADVHGGGRSVAEGSSRSRHQPPPQEQVQVQHKRQLVAREQRVRCACTPRPARKHNVTGFQASDDKLKLCPGAHNSLDLMVLGRCCSAHLTALRSPTCNPHDLRERS